MSSLTESAPRSLELGDFTGAVSPTRDDQFNPPWLDSQKLNDCRTGDLVQLFQSVARWRQDRQRRRLAAHSSMRLDERTLRDIGLDRMQSLYVTG